MLYQLPLGNYPGEVVRIDGPFDTWGKVLKIRSSGFNLIRGLGKTKPQGI